MVAGVQEDVDLEDKPPSRFLLPTGLVPRETTLFSGEEADEVTGNPRVTVLAPQKCAEPETKWYVGNLGGRGPGRGRPQTS